MRLVFEKSIVKSVSSDESTSAMIFTTWAKPSNKLSFTLIVLQMTMLNSALINYQYLLLTSSLLHLHLIALLEVATHEQWLSRASANKRAKYSKIIRHLQILLLKIAVLLFIF